MLASSRLISVTCGSGKIREAGRAPAAPAASRCGPRRRGWAGLARLEPFRQTLFDHMHCGMLGCDKDAALLQWVAHAQEGLSERSTVCVPTSDPVAQHAWMCSSQPQRRAAGCMAAAARRPSRRGPRQGGPAVTNRAPPRGGRGGGARRAARAFSGSPASSLASASAMWPHSSSGAPSSPTWWNTKSRKSFSR